MTSKLPAQGHPAPEGAWPGRAPTSMRDRVRDHDWAHTPLGPQRDWPASLRIAVDLVLSSRFPQCLVWGPAGITLYNDAFRPILGAKPEALGRRFRDVWREVWPTLEPVVERALGGEATYIEDFPLVIDRSGAPEQAWFTFCYSPVRDEHGVVQGMLDTVIETTDKMLAQQQLQQHAVTLEREVTARTRELTAANGELIIARDRAESAKRAKSAFLANMSHEVRTPLNAVIGLTQLLKDTALDAKQADWVVRVQAAGQHLLRILSDVLEASAIEADRPSLKMVDFELRPLIASCVKLVQRSAAAKGLRIEVDPASGLDRTLRGDSQRVAQMLLNLLVNAVQFTDQGWIRIGGHAQALEPGTHRLRIEVRDTGVGIAPEVQARLFQDFEQGDTSATRRVGGAGLGLSLTRKLAHAMGGEVGLTSEVGQGTSVWFTALCPSETG